MSSRQLSHGNILFALKFCYLFNFSGKQRNKQMNAQVLERITERLIQKSLLTRRTQHYWNNNYQF